jgi:hypothetical protein
VPLGITFTQAKVVAKRVALKPMTSVIFFGKYNGKHDALKFEW